MHHLPDFVGTRIDIANRNKKRKRNPAASTPETWKRAHTGYTLFVQENLLSIKENTAASQDEVINEKEIISTLARRWSQIDDLEKQSWQERADQLNVARVTEKRQTSVDLEHSVGTDIIEALDLREHDLMEADDESNARKAACK
jgi:hypothetical protein